MPSSPPKLPAKRELVVLALADLAAGTQVAATEDVAMRCFELAPKAFSWRKYPDQIDLDSVRVSLTDACKEKHGALAAGSVREGWYLTPSGVSWERENGDAMRSALHDSEPQTRPAARLETVHAAGEVARVKSSAAYSRWSAGEDVQHRAAAAAQPRWR